MADVTISGLSEGIPNNNTAVIPYSDGSTTYKTSPSGIVAASPGSIIQVQHYLFETSAGYANVNSWQYMFQADFTPKFNMSRVLIQSNFMYSGNGGIRLRRLIQNISSSVEIFHPWSTRPEFAPGQPSADSPYMLWDYYSAGNQSAWNNGSQRGTASFNVMDNPNTTNLINYSFDVKAHDSKGIGFNEHNRKDNGNPGAPSTVTIWEIAS